MDVGVHVCFGNEGKTSDVDCLVQEGRADDCFVVESFGKAEDCGNGFCTAHGYFKTLFSEGVCESVETVHEAWSVEGYDDGVEPDVEE